MNKMLFNVYYDESHFPYLNTIKYIVNETTGQQLSLEDFLNNLPTYDEVNYIANMNVFFPFLEEIMLKNKYECKHTNKSYYHHYTAVLKPKTYVADLYTRSDTGAMKHLSKMRIGSTGGQKYFINFNSYTRYQDINTPFPQSEIEYATFLSNRECKNATPAGEMRDQYKMHSLNSKNIIPGFVTAALSSIKNPAIIEAYAPGYHAQGWGYDVNSMYPAMMKKIKYLPDPGLAEMVEQPQLVPPNYFGWHQVSQYKWEVVFEGEIVWPGDWLVPPKDLENPFQDMVDQLYQEKQDSKKTGGSIYRFYKQKANSFIGSFAKKNRNSKHFTYWDDNNFRRDPLKRPGIPRYDIFAVITTMARRYITELMKQAQAYGCKVLQVNTDGFIVDKPLPESMLGEGLGALRLDKHLTNIYIFSSNRYVADGVQCISGLPDGMYKPGQTIYHYNKIMWVPSKGFKLVDTEINLMEDITNEN